jgi:osmotically-inducible protein OsmY
MKLKSTEPTGAQDRQRRRGLKRAGFITFAILAAIAMLPEKNVWSGASPSHVHAAAKPVSDDFLVDTIRQRLAADAVVRGGAIEVIVKDGNVTLRGKVEEDKQKSRAVKIARKVNGVKSVMNELQLSRP